jgi:hypothetical protein
MPTYMSVECNRCSASVLSHSVSVVEVFARLVTEPFVEQLGTHVVRCDANGKQSVHHDVSISVYLSFIIALQGAIFKFSCKPSDW